jgi:transcriptional regulator with XRE-family HTH domain
VEKQRRNPSEALATHVRVAREERGWTQSDLAQKADVSIDSVRRLEGGTFTLPGRVMTGGNLLDRLANVLDVDLCEMVRFFEEKEIEHSIYRHCLRSEESRLGQRPSQSLQDFIDQLPQDRMELVSRAALLNAHAIAFLVALEREFDAFEFLITNQPPFFLFADDEYVRAGSSSEELTDEDKGTYHSIIFEHKEWVRNRVRDALKHYKVVLHKQSLIAFLNSRSKQRASRIVADMKDLLRYVGFDLLILEASEPFEEFEILSGTYPFRLSNTNDVISIRHRQVGLRNTVVYQMALIGINDELVSEDHARAEAHWKRGMIQADDYPAEYSDYKMDVYPLRHKRITAHLLDDALRTAHPS